MVSCNNLRDSYHSISYLGKKENKKTGAKLIGSIVLMAFLLAGFSVVTYALGLDLVYVQENSFQTGRVSINLNNGESIIDKEEFLFEPGMTVVKDFFVENESTMDVYYKVYLENAEGMLADILDVTLREGDTVLYEGKASGMTITGVESMQDSMKTGEVRWLNISFRYPEGAGNVGQNTDMSFSICADAVQTVNNPDREFE